MNDKDLDKLIQEALRSDQELPEGLSGRLACSIEQWATDEKKHIVSHRKKRSLYWIGSVAASLIVGVAIFFQVENRYVGSKDTFSDPREAAVAAQNALALLSTQLNKGLNQVSIAGEEVNKANVIADKQFKALKAQ
ncbi:hypothetical protein [Bacteroides sp. UBA939]|uniref:hypothetical protein n=1 Tax=Bacteroides sp. UBA939 TaxID=1946092 RepID=UPI0025C35623|nr:hypothetical protein [Bacteroides sp. UBA939]